MKTALSFENLDAAFDVSTAGGSLHNDDTLDEDMTDWGVVSHNGSDVGSIGPTSPNRTCEYTDHGVVVLDTEEASQNQESASFDLSVPGTYSLPTDIASLTFSERHQQQEPSPTEIKKALVKKYLFWGMISFFTMLVLGLFHRQSSAYRIEKERFSEEKERFTMLEEELKERIRILEQQHGEQILMDAPIEEELLEESWSPFTLLDSCLLKVKMNVMVGDCWQDWCSTAEWKEYANSFYSPKEKWHSWFSGSDTGESQQQRVKDAWASFSSSVEDKVKSTSETLVGQTQEHLDRLSEATDKASDALFTFWDKTTASAKSIWDDVSKEDHSSAHEFQARLSEATDKASDALFSIWGKAAGSAKALWDDVAQLEEKHLKTFQKVLNGDVRDAAEMISSATQDFKEVLIQRGEEARDVASSFSSTTNEIIDDLTQKGEDLSEQVRELVQDAMTHLPNESMVEEEEHPTDL
eukprot:Nitzschia sp. Nitz4//scaffold178_size73299//48328//49728//NITZ4_005711-RA/size73299-processed-gene-0.14-mRNA-1//1//CDS//3329539158//2268//frame0